MTAMRIVAVLGVVAVLAGAGYLVTSMSSGGTQLRPDDKPLVILGASVYRQQCASCHGANLQGQPEWRRRGADALLPAPPHDASGHTWHHPDEHLFAMTKFGVQKFAGPNYRSAMPAYQDKLSDEEILAVLSYIKSRWPAEIRARHDELNRRYAASRQ